MYNKITFTTLDLLQFHIKYNASLNKYVTFRSHFVNTSHNKMSVSDYQNHTRKILTSHSGRIFRLIEVPLNCLWVSLDHIQYQATLLVVPEPHNVLSLFTELYALLGVCGSRF